MGYSKLTKSQGLIVYYMIVFASVVALQKLGLVIGDNKHETIQHAFGSVLILFSFFIVFDWESCYINEITLGHCDHQKISSVYMASEDGVVYDFWKKRVSDNKAIRYLTFIVTPMVLTIIGILLLGNRKISLR